MARLYIKCPVCNDGINPFPDLAVCPLCKGQRYVASGLSEGQFDLYRRKLAESTNYVVDSEARPRTVWFRNGRTVWVFVDKEGEPYLDVSWDSPAAPMRLKEGLVGGPVLDEDKPEPKAIYRVFCGGMRGDFSAWKIVGGATIRVSSDHHEVETAYEAILRDLGYHCPVVYRDDEEGGQCPDRADFGLNADGAAAQEPEAPPC